ncbi:MAG: shikimate dehydrogenase [Thiofilum sp.]|uniref:shikimate dehydrogenase n=1 Tax=Thiofilum sp. TaxID=2212733 RepID=UPI0025DD5FF9|nr:shikimate dehydrogenase [Thiofilum sp.]MBK8455284.1 shikimate dehydrogenase [Thiofilum sp.]
MAHTLDHYAVIGNPVQHSKSPQIHTLFAQQTAQALQYDKLLAPFDAFTATVQSFRAAGGKGCNVTVPFKQEAWTLATERSAYAERAGAVNTLSFHADGSIWGANTDGIGLVRDLMQNQGLVLKQKRILILGAGGAVRGVLQPLLEQQPAELVIANRTVSKAHELAQAFADLGQVSGCSFEAVIGRFDVIINGTSASLQGELPPIPTTCINAETFCYDMMYSAKPTVFMQWAAEQGANQVVDGLGMLVEQAAEAFYIWRGVRPETQPVLQQLMMELKAKN